MNLARLRRCQPASQTNQHFCFNVCGFEPIDKRVNDVSQVFIQAYRLTLSTYFSAKQFGDLIFSPDTAKVVDFLSRTEAKGGEGYCADVFGGLEEAINMDWQYPTRVGHFSINFN